MSGTSSSQDELEVPWWRGCFASVRYYAPVIFAIAAVVSLAAFFVYRGKDTDYRATMRVVQEDGPLVASIDLSPPGAVEMETLANLVTTRPVLRAAARQIDGESVESLRSRVDVSVQPGTKILEISVEDDVAEDASTTAGILYGTFQAVRAGILESHLTSIEQDLDRAIAAANSPALATRMRARQRGVATTRAVAGSDLVVVEGPEPPRERLTPSAVPEAAAAFGLVGLFGVAVALFAGSGRARPTDSRELAQWLGIEPLALVPSNAARLGRHTAVLTEQEHAAYHLARARLQQSIGDDHPTVTVITGASYAEGATSATASLGRAFAEAGQHVLLVGADARHRGLMSVFGIETDRGFFDLAGTPELSAEGSVTTIDADFRAGGKLALLPAGDPPERPPSFTAQEIEAAFNKLRPMGWDVILVDAPPLLVSAEAHVTAAAADGVIVVARLEDVSRSKALELRAALKRLRLARCDLLMIGGSLRGPLRSSRRAWL